MYKIYVVIAVANGFSALEVSKWRIIMEDQKGLMRDCDDNGCFILPIPIF